ncbi:MAG: signal peptidase I [Chitinophagaceae bacterium]
MILDKKKIIKGNFWLYVILGVLVSAFFLRVFVFEIYTVERNSMNNSFFDGDKVVINKLCKKSLSRNDVVVFHHYRDAYIKRCIGMPGEIIEIKNGTIIINGKKIDFPSKAVIPDTIQSLKLNPKYVTNIVMLDIYGKYWDLKNFGPYIIPKKGMKIQLTNENLKLYKNNLESTEEMAKPVEENNGVNNSYTFQHDYYFVLGDNRPKSDDSRSFGAINETQIIGKTSFRF